jgi:hypothetical protein
MPRKSPVKLIHDVSAYGAADHTVLFPNWRYAREFSKACEKDGGRPQENSSAAVSQVYCEKEGLPFWEYVEGYADVRPLYTGPPLDKDHTVFYRAIALAPISN